MSVVDYQGNKIPVSADQVQTSTGETLDKYIERMDGDAYVTTRKVADGAINNSKLANSSVSAEKIQSGAITEEKIAVASVTAGKIASGAVTSEKLSNSSVTSDKIVRGSVFSDKLADKAVTAEKLADDVTKDLEELRSYMNADDSRWKDVDSKISDLQNFHYPIEVNFKVTPNDRMESETISFDVMYRGILFNPDKITLTKTAGDETELLLEGAVQYATIDSHVKEAKETFLLTVEASGHNSVTKEITKYLVFYGASSEGSLLGYDFSKLDFGKTIVEDVQIDCTITTEDGDYIWVIIPQDLDIEKITSQGFEVVMNDYVLYTNSLGTFKAYRSTNKLASNTWNLKIN